MSQSNGHNEKYLIIGLGNELCGDDAIGIDIVWALEEKLPGKADYHIEQNDLTNLLDFWKEKNVIIVDCLYDSETVPGEVFSFSSFEKLMQFKARSFSTHGISLIEVYQLGCLLKKLPHKLMIYGISGSHFQVGTNPGNRVKKAGEKVVKYLTRHLLKSVPTF